MAMPFCWDDVWTDFPKSLVCRELVWKTGHVICYILHPLKACGPLCHTFLILSPIDIKSQTALVISED